MPQQNAPDAVRIVPGTDTVLLYGVSYDLGLFRALAARLGEGARCELFTNGDGRLDLYTHRRGAGGTTPPAR